jgi:hypothetical protein
MFIPGTNSIKDTGYDVANSIRFNNGYDGGLDDAYMHRTPGSAGNRRTFTLSAWIKRGSHFNDEQPILAAAETTTIRFSSEGGSNSAINIYFYSGGWVFRVHTNAEYRDPSAWMHLVVAFDTTQGVAANRIKIYVNGTQVTSMGNADYPTEDYETAFNNDVLHSIGRNANSSDYYDGYLSEVVMIDGLALAPTSFGEFDSDSPTIWKPIDVSGLTFGTNGFYLDFEDSSNLGNDASGGTDFTEVSVSSYDQTTDTPTNNFATYNPLMKFHSSMVLAEGNLKATTANSYASDASNSFFSTIGMTAGKWYWEVKVITAPTTNVLLGIAFDLSAHQQGTGGGLYNFSYTTLGYSYNSNGSIGNDGGGWVEDGSYDAYTANDIISFALDMDNHKFYVGKNGTWQNSGDPTSGATGTGAASIATGNTYFAAASDNYGSNVYVYSANFGSPPYDNSSSVADGNGYGAFEYAVPSGYLALCTKNLGSDGG